MFIMKSRHWWCCRSTFHSKDLSFEMVDKRFDWVRGTEKRIFIFFQLGASLSSPKMSFWFKSCLRALLKLLKVASPPPHWDISLLQPTGIRIFFFWDLKVVFILFCFVLLKLAYDCPIPYYNTTCTSYRTGPQSTKPSNKVPQFPNHSRNEHLSN